MINGAKIQPRKDPAEQEETRIHLTPPANTCLQCFYKMSVSSKLLG